MADPFFAEIRIMSFNFPPKGWAFCKGQTLPINQNQALFSLLGTSYGGNGQTTFALPNLEGRTPISMGAGHVLGEAAGQKSHVLSVQELPAHNHALMASPANGTTPIAAANVLAAANNLYAPPTNLVPLDPSSLTPIGGSQAHENMQPYLVLNFCIALQGIFPSQN